MTDNNTHDTDSKGESAIEADGGLGTGAGHEPAEYLHTEVNIFRPSTPFMRDHLRLVWGLFAAWALVVFGPVTATYLATDVMTSITVLGFPLHYILTAIGAPFGALALSAVYAHKRDQLDEKYGIDHGTTPSDVNADTAAVDGGAE